MYFELTEPEKKREKNTPAIQKQQFNQHHTYGIRLRATGIDISIRCSALPIRKCELCASRLKKRGRKNSNFTANDNDIVCCRFEAQQRYSLFHSLLFSRIRSSSGAVWLLTLGWVYFFFLLRHSCVCCFIRFLSYALHSLMDLALIHLSLDICIF